MTADEFARFRDRKNFELLDGRLSIRPSGARASFFLGNLLFALLDYTRRCGPEFAVVSSLACRCFPGRPDHVRWASGGGFRTARLTSDDWQAELCPVTPDLIITVRFPGDSAEAVTQRVSDWRSAGTQLLWMIDPDDRTVTAYEASDAVRLYDETDTLTGEPVLPGFSCPVADLFRLPAPPTR